jgi:hypothetical protein
MHEGSLYEQELLAHARQFAETGDVYNAIKLLRRIIKTAPDWWLPHADLSDLFKRQGDWKATFHYAKRTVALQAGHAPAWLNLGIAATALKKPHLARIVWNKFGFTPPSPRALTALRISSRESFEIVWAHPLDPARALLTSIPDPATGRRFHDTLLVDAQACGHTVSHRRRYPVFDVLGVLKHSSYHTFALRTDTTDRKALRILEQLCHQSDMGFENWDNITRVKPFQSEQALQEFYGHDILPPADADTSLIAIAAREPEQLSATLQRWSVITLSSCSTPVLLL